MTEERPPCPKCKREVNNYFDHTAIDCKGMREDELAAIMELKDAYARYLNRCNDLESTQKRFCTFPMSFDDWVRSMADNLKDHREGK
jgi:hypothetical protein